MAPRASWMLPSQAPPILPGRPHLALAIAILRLKPDNFTVREYLSHLRQHIRLGQPAYSANEQTHYLDLVSYWQEQCQIIQAECESLKSINVKLERSNHLLAGRSGTVPDDSPSTAKAKAKRKAPASLSRSSKRQKDGNGTSVATSAVQTHDVIESDYDFLEGLGPDGALLLEKLYTTHQLCRTSDSEPEMLCKSLVQLTLALTKVIAFIAHNHEHLSRNHRRPSCPVSLEDDKSDFAHALTVAARAFMSVIVGTAKMVDMDNDQRYSSLITCELTGMFSVALLGIEHCARRTAEVAAVTPGPVSKAKGKPGADAAKPKESVAARSLAHFLIGLLGLLDEGNPLHHKIFDGFVFVLLERVGKRLYFCTFGRHRGPTLESSLVPGPEIGLGVDKVEEKVENLGIRLEVKALILILHRAMGLAPHHMKQSNSKATDNTNPIQRTLSMKVLSSAPKSRLGAIAKDRLQQTLVTCMYGGKGDDEFLDVLTKPVPGMRISSLPNVSKVHDEDVEQWYKEEVWRLVGWDILAKDSGCKDLRHCDSDS